MNDFEMSRTLEGSGNEKRKAPPLKKKPMAEKKVRNSTSRRKLAENFEDEMGEVVSDDDSEAESVMTNIIFEQGRLLRHLRSGKINKQQANEMMAKLIAENPIPPDRPPATVSPSPPQRGDSASNKTMEAVLSTQMLLDDDEETQESQEEVATQQTSPTLATSAASLPLPHPLPAMTPAQIMALNKPSPFEGVEDVEILQEERRPEDRVYPEVWLDNNWKFGIALIKNKEASSSSSGFDVWYVQR
jgi:hypothetical protein